MLSKSRLVVLDSVSLQTVRLHAGWPSSQQQQQQQLDRAAAVLHQHKHHRRKHRATKHRRPRNIAYSRVQLGEFTQEAPRLHNPFNADVTLRRYLQRTITDHVCSFIHSYITYYYLYYYCCCCCCRTCTQRSLVTCTDLVSA